MDQDGTCCGVMAWDLSTGQLHRYRAKQVILATGGYGRAYFSATSAHTCTGDGNGMALRSEEHTSELQSLMRISYAVFCLKNNNKKHSRTIRSTCHATTPRRSRPLPT